MDFMTAFPYWGILVLVALNAFLVVRRRVEVESRDDDETHH